MVNKHRPSEEELALARNTLDIFDPERTTVAVGSLAIVAQLHDNGVESPIGCEDVDVLCSQDFFNNLLRTGPFMEGVNKFQVRWPKGRLLERGATNKAVDIYSNRADTLGFTACYSMSDLWYPIDYDSCQTDVIEASSIRCLRIDRMLEWVAIVGRPKDTETVEKVLPLATSAGLVDEDHLEAIQRQLDVTYAEREAHPERYFARMDI